MPELLSCNIRPMIRVTGATGSYYVSVGPVVPKPLALQRFGCGLEALNYSMSLRARHGSSIHIADDWDLGDGLLGGAA